MGKEGEYLKVHNGVPTDLDRGFVKLPRDFSTSFDIKFTDQAVEDRIVAERGIQ